MQHTNLGRTGLKVSRLCLGTMNFGPITTEPDSFAIMDKSLEAGLQFFDTANVYGWKTGEGVTEQIVGRWLAQGGGRREQVVLATKYQGNMGSGVNDRGASAKHIRHAAEGSLKRLQTDYIDLYQMHHINRDTPWDEIWQAIDVLVQQGKILYAGSSNYPGWGIVQANEAAAKKGMLGLVSEQSKYSLACRHIELEVLPACRAYGVGVITWSPLDGGFLGGVLGPKATTGRRANEHVQKRIENERPRLEKWEGLCKELSETPANIALAWQLHMPGITGPIIGPRTMAQLDEVLRVVDIKLDEDTLKKIDQIWPGPGGPNARTDGKGLRKNEAPEAYAW